MQPGNFGELIRNVTRMRKDMDRVQEGLRSRYVEGRAGGDLVEATLNGRQELVKLTLNEKVLQPGQDGRVDKALVEDLIVAAVSQGLEKSRALMRQEMEKVTGDQGLAGLLPGLLG